MDIFVFIKSIDKIALVLFFLIGVSLIYEFSLFIKGTKDKAPKIPKFAATEISYHKPKELPVQQGKKPQKKSKELNIITIILLIVFMLVLGAVYLIGTFIDTKNNNKSLKNFPTPTVSVKKVVFSKGIKIYNKKWQEINNSNRDFLKQGQTIIIGVETIPLVKITKVRIRVNSKVWKEENETEDFNKKFGVFYKEYLIAANEGKLVIEAQLYSLKEGWPIEKYEKK